MKVAKRRAAEVEFMSFLVFECCSIPTVQLAQKYYKLQENQIRKKFLGIWIKYTIISLIYKLTVKT